MPFPNKPKKTFKSKVIGPMQSIPPPAAVPIQPPSAAPFPLQGAKNVAPIAVPQPAPIASPVPKPPLLGATTARTIPTPEIRNPLGSITSVNALSSKSPAAMLLSQEAQKSVDMGEPGTSTGSSATGSLGSPLPAKPLQKSEEAAAEMEKVNEILQNYLELCDSTMHNWTPAKIVDIIHVLARSLCLDVVSLALIDPDNESKFLPIVSRGYHSPPGADIISIWEGCLAPEGATVNWPKLMNSTSSPETPLASWVLHEGLHKFGYAPVHDGKTIYGFIVTGAYKRETISPLASTILEMLGGRMGLSLGVRRNRGDWPESVLETAKALRDHFSMVLGVFEMLKEGGKLTQDELISLAESGARSLSEGMSLLDKLTEEAAGGKPGH